MSIRPHLKPLSRRAQLIQRLHRLGAGDRLVAGLFARQIEVRSAIQGGARRVAVRCSRRSGKSYLSNTMLAELCARKPDARTLYLALTHDSVRRMSWDAIHRLDRQYGLDGRFNEAFLRVSLPYGGSIEYCGVGASASGEVSDRFRGAAFDAVVIDEASKFKPAVLAYLIESVIEPTLMDRGGWLMLTGTPTANASGLFFDATFGEGLPGWSQFFWIGEDNPHIAAQWREAVARKRALNSQIDEDADFRREYFGEWAKDLRDTVYLLDEGINVIDIIPDTDWKGHAISIDLGWTDATAITVGAWRAGDPTLYVLESARANRERIDQLAGRIAVLREKYPGAIVVMDIGSGGSRNVQEELAYRYHIPTLPAEKTDKRGAIGFCNADCALGRVKIARAPNKELIADLKRLPKRVKADGTWEEDPAFANDLADSFLYLHRISRHYVERPRDVVEKSYADKMFDKHMLQQQSMRWRR